MRDKKRIKPFLAEVNKLWAMYPDYRFGQLIYMIADNMHCGDIFFPEEKDWLKSIEELIGD